MIVLVSGGFDPIHSGHVRLLQAAAKHGRVVVALNSDEWLFRKKGYYFQDFEERREILLDHASVSLVVPVNDTDGTVCDALERLRPHYFANGGDRANPNEAEHALCLKYGIRELFGIGGDKVQSSSALVQRVLQHQHP